MSWSRLAASVCERSFEPAIVDQALASPTDRETWQALRDTLSRAERMDLVERMKASLEDIRFDSGQECEDAYVKRHRGACRGQPAGHRRHAAGPGDRAARL